MTEAASSRHPLLTILGDVGVDHVLGPIDGWPAIGTEVMARRSDLRPGGSGGNAALAARALGRRSRLLSGIGDDSFGGWLAGQFIGIDVVLHTTAAPTSVSVCILHSEGDRSILTTEGHLEIVQAETLVGNLPPAPDGSVLLLTGAFIMPAVSGDYDRIIADARTKGYSIALDTGWPPQGWDAVRQDVARWLAMSDHALLNDLEVRALAGIDDIDEAIAHVSAMMADNATLVVKLGSDGALGMQNGQSSHSPGIPTEVFDTVGAGDAFNAGYLDAWLDGASLHEALAAGCRSATAIISRFPRASMPPATSETEPRQAEA